jgi:predicted phosphodiesterase
LRSFPISISGQAEFGHSDEDFLRFLRFLEDDFQRIVLLGDIWETLTGVGLGAAKQQLRAARERHPEIARRFERPQYLYVHGNHDWVAGEAEGVPEQLQILADGVRIVFNHGHRGDQLVARHRWLSELGVWLGAWVCRIGWRRLYSLCSKLDALRCGAAEAPRCVVRSWAERHASDERADIIVTGHTHVAARADLGSCLFMNSGSCSEGHLNFLALDTKRSDYSLHLAA